MNLFQDYFSDYVSDFQLSTLGAGVIRRFAVKRAERELTVVLALNELVDYSVFKSAEESIKKNMGLEKVSLKPRYVSERFEPSYLPSIVEFVKRGNPAANGFFDGAETEYDGNTLTVKLKKGGREILLAQKVNEEIESVIFDLFGLDLKIQLVETESYDIEKEVKKAYEKLRTDKEQEKKEQEKNVQHKRLGDLPVYIDTKKNIYGKNIKETPKNIADIRIDDGVVTVWGDVLKHEAKETRRGGNKIFTFDITDYTSSVTCKMFDSNSVIDAIVNRLSSAKTVMVTGRYQLDKYTNEYLILPDGIASVLKAEKEDNAPEKRVELHLHTSLSAMDGISSPTALVNRAAKWGHKAIAVTDHGVVQALPEASKAAKSAGIKLICGMEGYLVDDEKYPDFMHMKTRDFKRNHIIFLIKNLEGRKVLYKHISASNVKYYKNRPLIPKSILRQHRNGIVIGSACEQGEVYQAILNGATDEELDEIASFYDYLEIQPNGNNEFMLRTSNEEYVLTKKGEERKNVYWRVRTQEDLININKRIVACADRLGKMTVATGDVHFLDEHDAKFRAIIMASKGFDDADQQAPLYFKTTEEMLKDFEWAGDRAKEFVIYNPNKIADLIDDDVVPIPPGTFQPHIDGAEEELTETCWKNAKEKYGDPVPEEVGPRLQKELDSIIKHGYAVLYVIAKRLVKNSEEHGYLVGSRGSVGSSLVAHLGGISEVNPLPPHYVCPKCKHSEFVTDGSVGSGFDLPPKNCPVCGEPMDRDGHEIPFETFLGFDGDKEPDIDLNFSGEYQSKAHKYTEVIFGEGQTFKAGTIGTLADKTAFGYVKNYYEERGVHKRNCEIDRIVLGCVGVRRTTGQHPGGIVVLPMGEQIYTFTPVQHPANDMTVDITTTHFDYHSIDHNLLKLDILGHDDPTMIRMLQDLTGVDPTQIPLDDKAVMSLFQDTSALGITPDDLVNCQLGALGIPEFGTDFAMGMLIDTQPKEFSDLVRIAGLSHGTDVWLGNAQTLIQEKKATISTAICTRDDIMIYLISMGLDSEESFKIMENVRKGIVAKGKCDKWPEWKQDMIDHNVPDWYIWSCEKIKYMFPKAHAAAYVMMAWRIAYCKVFYPLAYYAAYFSIRATAFSYELMCQGKEKLEGYMHEYEKRKDELSKKEQDTYKDMRLVQEMYARGFEFLPLDIYKSEPHHFQIVDGKLLPALNTIDGLGDNAAVAIAEAAKDGIFLSKDDFRERTKVSKTTIELMSDLGLFGDMPESNQLSLFDFGA